MLTIGALAAATAHAATAFVTDYFSSENFKSDLRTLLSL